MKVPMAFACLSLLIATQAPTKTQLPSIDAQGEDYLIYSIVLDQMFAKSNTQRIVIGDYTMMSFPPIMMGMTSFGDPLKGIRQTICKDTLADYDEKRKLPVHLESKFLTGIPVVLISEAERNRIFGINQEGEKQTAARDGMQELRRLYPNSQGFMSLSRVGFNKDATQAIVYLGNVCGGLCGSGQFFLLAKDNGKWKIKLSSMAWVS